MKVAISILKKFVRKSLNVIGFDIVRLTHNPKYTLLGLSELPIKTVIDIGANAGQFARYIMGIFPQAQLYCFEPLPEPFQQLQLWAEQQQGQVTAFNVAIGDIEGTEDMFYHTEHSPSSSLLPSTAVTEKLYPFTKKQTHVPVTLTTIDKALDNVTESLSPDILVKLDVQGYEDRVIRGGRETFRKAKTCVLEVCLDQLYEKQADFKDVLLMLYDLGYRYIGNLQQAYGDDGHVVAIDAVFIK